MRIRATIAGVLLAVCAALYFGGQADATPYQPAVGVFHAFDIPASSATAIVTGSMTPGRFPVVAYAITISLQGTDSVVNFTSSDGTKTLKEDLNGGTALTAGNVYTFLVGARKTTLNNGSAIMVYNVECETTTTVGRLQIDEVRSDVR